MSDRARDDHEKNSDSNGRTPICNWNNSGCDKRIRNSNHLVNHIRFEHELKPMPSAKRYKINPLWRGPRISGSVLRHCSVCGDDFLHWARTQDAVHAEGTTNFQYAIFGSTPLIDWRPILSARTLIGRSSIALRTATNSTRRSKA